MADPEQLAILQRGVADWNTWRQDHAGIDVDLHKANLHRADLSRADLTGAYLSEADLSRADLREANLTGAYLTGAYLSEANLSQAVLLQAELTDAALLETLLINIDLSTVKGLESCRHFGPSTLDHRTLAQSGKLPLPFLRGVGLPDRLIEYLPSLLGEAFQYYACFISYSARDDDFARRLHADLQDRGVRCWFAPEDLKTGARIRVGIDEAIKVHDKLLLILSEHSIASQWVEQEVEDALDHERQTGKTILFPIRLDDTIMSISSGWPRLCATPATSATCACGKTTTPTSAEAQLALEAPKEATSSGSPFLRDSEGVSLEPTQTPSASGNGRPWWRLWRT